MRPRTIAFALVAVSILVIAVSSAYAQDTNVAAARVWDAVSPYVVSAISAGIIAVTTWATAVFQRYTGIQVEARHREALHSACMTGVLSALNAFGNRLEHVTFDARSQIIKSATEWVLRSVPDAVAYFKVDNNALHRLIEAKLTEQLNLVIPTTR